MKEKVLIAAPIHAVLRHGLEERGYELIDALNITQATAAEQMNTVTGILTSTRLQLDKKLIDAAPLLKWIGRMGSGMEVIDLPYAQQKGIRCFSSPEGNANAVGEHALGMLLSLTKKITLSHTEIKEGKWLREENRGIELEGKTIGIIGFGHTGKAFVKKLRGFDMNILAYDKYKQDKTEDTLRFCPDLQAIYEQAEIISFHVPLQQDTHHYFDTAFLQQMQQPFILINTSRGKVVHTDALVEGLQSGKIKGACLDVFEEEPLGNMSAEVKEKFMYSLSFPNVVSTPHIAGYSHEALYKMSKALLDKIVMYV